jgi:hypothetical protein
MKTYRHLLIPVIVVASCGLAILAGPALLNTTRIEQLTGMKGKLDDKEGVFKVSLPRTDLQVTVGGVRMTPPMGLTCWAAFKRVGDHTVVMGDQVLLEDQVNPVMDAALDNGLEVTALHNHFLWDSPRVMFMHVGGMGDEEKLAAAVGKVFAKIRETSGSHGEPAPATIDPAKSTLDPAKVDAVLGRKGELSAGVYKVTIGRTTKMGDHEMGNAMGVNTWAAFAGSDDQAVVDGDFAMYEGEVQGVLKALRHSGIRIVALHNHMTGESPRVIFLHFWGTGSTRNLAEGLKAALDTQPPGFVAGLAVSESEPSPPTVSFDNVRPGELPNGWTAGVTGRGTPKWMAAKDDTAPSKPNVLAQTGEGTFPFCVDTGVSLRDGFVEVKFKPISGREDQAGGLIWRFQDKDNYYVARANALEDNVTIYHTVKGVRRAFKNVDMKVSPKEWHTLRVDFQGSRFTVRFDGKTAIEASDDTFSGPGGVGVWTKADSITHFDDFRYGPPGN